MIDFLFADNEMVASCCLRIPSWKLAGEGYPVRTVYAGSGRTVEVVKAESRSVPATEFQAPPGFERNSLREIMRRYGCSSGASRAPPRGRRAGRGWSCPGRARGPSGGELPHP